MADAAREAEERLRTLPDLLRYSTVAGERSLGDDIRTLLDALSELRADTERMNWLQVWLREEPGHHLLSWPMESREYTLFQPPDEHEVRRLGMRQTLREAIDAARRTPVGWPDAARASEGGAE